MLRRPCFFGPLSIVTRLCCLGPAAQEGDNPQIDALEGFAENLDDPASSHGHPQLQKHEPPKKFLPQTTLQHRNIAKTMRTRWPGAHGVTCLSWLPFQRFHEISPHRSFNPLLLLVPGECVEDRKRTDTRLRSELL
ncbi:unnamed protein product [Symbiodinium natans]|uniref:Uncharacterized protein n=1 Tax=Symbiodinium natans TaxID=878477 RepID=A0A812NWV5_9DINO|nr:unnamed protein product [Symbiodinium natans]